MHFINQAHVEHAGDKARADALNLVWSGFAAGKNGAIDRLNRDGLEPRFALLDVAGYAGDGAARAYAGTSMSTLPSVSSQISGPVVA